MCDLVIEIVIEIVYSDRLCKKKLLRFFQHTYVLLSTGLNNNAFAHTLETTMLQPGINVDMVSVSYLNY